MKDLKKMIPAGLLLLAFAVCSCAAYAGDIGDAVKLHDKGKRMFNREKYGEAAAYFKQAINDCPDSAMTQVSMYYLADSYEKMGKKDKAAQTYNELVTRYKSGYWVDLAQDQLKNG